MKKNMLVLMLCAGVVTAGNAAEAESKKDMQTFPSENITGVTIRTNSALIHVESAPAAAIQVEQLPDNARACNVTIKVSRRPPHPQSPGQIRRIQRHKNRLPSAAAERFFQ